MKKQFCLNLDISYWTIFLWLILIVLHAEKMVFFCYGLMFLHECAHVVTALLLKCSVEKITIYPFGLCAHIQHTHHLRCLQRILLYGAGPFVHLLMMPVLSFLADWNLISQVMSEYLQSVNLNYLIFNLFPIYPLDGYQLLHSLWLGIFPYRMALYTSQLISFLGLSVLWLIRPHESLIYLICLGLLLLVNVIKCLGLEKEIQNFYLIRCISDFKGKNKVHSYQDLFVYCTNWIICSNHIISEQQLLKKILKLEGK